MDPYNSPIGAAMDRLGFGAASDYGLQAPTSGGATMGYGLRAPQAGGASLGYGLDPAGLKNLWDTQLQTWGQTLDQTAAQQQAQQQSPSGSWGGGWNGAGAGATVAGGDWAALDAHNDAINAVAQQTGVPANLLKAMINNESSGNWDRDGNRISDPGDGGGPLIPFVGVRSGTAASVGIDFNQMLGNKQLQIEAMARVLQRDYQNYGTWQAAASNYLTGDPQAYLTGGADSGGLPANYYVKKAMDGWNYLDSLGGGTTAGSTVGGGWGGNSAAGVGPNQVVDAATSYVNRAPYIWGSVPNASQDPTVSGWDCSGMISWLASKYAPTSGIPAGSHYQFQWAQQSGNLFNDPSQLKPGDIVFWDTGGREGGGSFLNGASHVAMYIGNGKMVHAANPSAGTIISDFANYQGMYSFLGAAHMPWSGGASYSGQGGMPVGAGTGGYPQQQPAYNSNQILMRLLSGQSTPGYG